MNTPYRIGVAGSTQFTTACAQSLAADERFELAWVLTPPPKPVGRSQILTPSPLETWATEQNIPVIHVPKRIDDAVEAVIRDAGELDFLLVVDFGYIVPDWLLTFPRLPALNIHPSLLPRWRGSSPGQFCLLYGDTESAVSLMEMSSELDAGPLIAQIPFAVNSTWNHAQYYEHAFDLIIPQLPQLLAEYATQPIVKPQAQSTTPIARRLRKDDAYIAWPLLQALMRGETVSVTEELPADYQDTSQLLSEAAQASGSWLETVERAVRALSPWPQVWTEVETNQGPTRMKLLSVSITGDELELNEVHIAGKNPAAWNEIKNSVKK